MNKVIGVRFMRPSVLAFIFLCAIPTLLAAGYYGFCAQPIFRTTVQFGVRPAAPSQIKSDGAGIAQSVPMSSEVGATSYGVVRYIESDAFIRDLEAKMDLHAFFGRERGDFLDYLSVDADSEQKLRYIKNKIEPYFDITTGLVSVSVDAFSAQDSYNISIEVLKMSEKLINDISERIRIDAVTIANRDVDRVGERLAKRRRELQGKLAQYGIIDQSTVALNNLQVINKLEDDLLALEAQRKSIESELSQDSPVMKNLDLKIRFVNERIKRLSNSSGLGGSAQDYAPRVAELENIRADILVLEKQFSSVADARIRQITNAERQSLYLIKFVDAVLPDSATRPRGIRAVLVIFIAGALISLIVAFAWQAVRDHRT